VKNKQAISVALRFENLMWLRGRVRSTGEKSVSELLDRIIASARKGEAGHEAGIRSVRGTVTIAPEDPDLTGADEVVRALLPSETADRQHRISRRTSRRVPRS
jgi:hypothetical protein